VPKSALSSTGRIDRLRLRTFLERRREPKAMTGEAKKAMEKWERRQGLKRKDLEGLKRDLERLLGAESGQIRGDAGTGRPSEALNRMAKLNAVASAALL
jgi:hypothetical protein